MDIDVYEIKGTLKEFEDTEDWIEYPEDKRVGLIDVENTPIKIRKKLIEMGYNETDRVLVIIQ